MILLSQVMRNHVEELATIVVDGLKYPHCLVRCAATDAIKALSVNLAPTLHEHYHRTILPLLTEMLKEMEDTVWVIIFSFYQFLDTFSSFDCLYSHMCMIYLMLLCTNYSPPGESYPSNSFLQQWLHTR